MQRQAATFGLRTRDFDERDRVLVAAGHAAEQLRGTGFIEQAHAQAFERAREYDLLDRATRDEIRREMIALARDLDLFGPQYGDHFVFAHTLKRLGADCAHGS